ncbi:MAG: hypothetical protein MJZ46_07645 [Bacteroidales bacterium]|nr:hypothetical protein [Bacteroidales bacterium]
MKARFFEKSNGGQYAVTGREKYEGQYYYTGICKTRFGFDDSVFLKVSRLNRGLKDGTFQEVNQPFEWYGGLA